MRGRGTVSFALAVALAVSAHMLARGYDTPRPVQTPPSSQGQERPTFRTEVNFVRVDVYPSVDGKPLGDLTLQDFEILEDGVPQKIAAFEHIVVRKGGDPSERVEPRNVLESNQMAADPRNRLFVMFLDSFHVTDDTSPHDSRVRLPGSPSDRMPPERRLGPPLRIDRALANFLERTIGPDDLVAAMTPEMEAREITFVRRPASLEEFLKPVWARRFSLENLDPEQERWNDCYPKDDREHRFDGIFEEMVLRRREELTIRALGALVARLGELREERKGILLISEGWLLFRPNDNLSRKLGGIARPQPLTIHTGVDGRLAPGTDPRTFVNLDWQKCETERLRLAALNHAQVFRDLLDQANRANASFYPVDPRGLAVFDTPINYHEIYTPPPGRDAAQVARPTSATEDQTRLRERLEVLRTLAVATDGVAMLDSNDLGASLRRVVDDLSTYYLLGYYSTNAKPDGTFRKITVRVKRPGVSVRTRSGYRAATAAEVAARARAAVLPDPEVRIRDLALASLDLPRADRALRVMGGYAWERPAEGGLPPRPVLWIAGQLDDAAARLPEWSGGGEVAMTMMSAGGQAGATERVTVSAAARSFVRYLREPRVAAGDHLIRVRLRGKAGTLADATEQVRIAVPALASGAQGGMGQPLLFRRGPFTGPAFQPTADTRFRRAERIRVDVPVAGTDEPVSARLLDRRGQALPIPAVLGSREEDGLRFVTAELALAPLGPADYLIEVSIRLGPTQQKIVAAFRIVP